MHLGRLLVLEEIHEIVVVRIGSILQHVEPKTAWLVARGARRVVFNGREELLAPLRLDPGADNHSVHGGL